MPFSKPAVRSPTTDGIKWAVSGKHRPFNKALLKELLGVRRETAYKSDDQPNSLAWWQPSRKLPAHPPSGIVLFCSDANALNYADPAVFWGLEMIHHKF